MNSPLIDGEQPLKPSLSPVTQVFISMGLAVIAADFLVYHSNPATGFSIFCLFMAMLVMWNRSKQRLHSTVGVLAVLLIISTIAGVLHSSFSNVLCLITLTFALAADSFYVHIQRTFVRITGLFRKIYYLPFRWLDLTSQWVESRVLKSNDTPSQTGKRILFAVKVVVPAFIILVPFVLLLMGGNAIFAKELANVFTSLIHLLEAIQFPSILHILFWAGVAICAAYLVYPPYLNAPAVLVENPPLPQTSLVPLSAAQFIAILGGGNLLYALVNGIDIRYLWLQDNIPEGITYTDYVHSGVYYLIASVFLSALVMTMMKEARPGVVQHSKPVRILASLWIAQNGILILSTALRLKKYVDEFLLTTTRVYVIYFLLLVLAGFIALAWYILKNKRFTWLLCTNVVLTFFLFFIIQFDLTSTWVARYNVTNHALAGKSIDIKYLEELGPPAWPALIELAQKDGDAVVKTQAHGVLQKIIINRAATKPKPWQSFQWHHHRAAKALEEYQKEKGIL